MNEQPTSLRFSHVVQAPVETVFRAWTDPVELAHWWGPTGARNMASNQLRPGGSWRLVMQTQDGAEHPTHGTYTEIEVPTKLCFTVDTSEHPKAWQDQLNAHRQHKRLGFRCLLQAIFTPDGTGTRLDVALRFDDPEDVAAVRSMGAEQAWAQSFERLDALMAVGANAVELRKRTELR